MNGLRSWWIGFSLIIIFILMSELAVVFRDYVFSRLGLNRNLVLTLLWLLPAIASFVVVYFSRDRKILKGLSLIPLLSVLGPIIHFLFGKYGATIDFGGLEGLRVTFQIYFALSAITIVVGMVVGWLFNKSRKQV